MEENKNIELNKQNNNENINNESSKDQEIPDKDKEATDLNSNRIVNIDTKAEGLNIENLKPEKIEIQEINQGVEEISEVKKLIISYDTEDNREICNNLIIVKDKNKKLCCK